MSNSHFMYSLLQGKKQHALPWVIAVVVNWLYGTVVVMLDCIVYVSIVSIMFTCVRIFNSRSSLFYFIIFLEFSNLLGSIM